jgi:oxygen-independent coproporphyrinogen-3 oxidase
LAGLYLHIPFCRKLCYYCDFHFTVSLKQKQRLVYALVSELKSRKPEAEGTILDTIYFGGGTPSVLTMDELVLLFKCILGNYHITTTPEITFEANPDDLDAGYLKDILKYTPVNRLSIGVQSFNDKELKLLNRRHTTADAIHCIEHAKEAGFTNLNIDLIYGIPGMTTSGFKKNLELFKRLDIPHLSAYHLTIEPKTVFGYYQKKGKIKAVSETISLRQFDLLMTLMEPWGYDHYEISNFARPGYYSKHNLGYWTGKPYFGIGPSAHSYLNNIRRWNIANNTAYIESIENDRNDYFETEPIDRSKAYNEYLLTSLRTKWGIDTDYILEAFGSAYDKLITEGIRKFVNEGILLQDQKQIMLSRKGKMIADYVISELMMV